MKIIKFSVSSSSNAIGASRGRGPEALGRNSWPLRLAVVAATILVPAGSALAHHSFAMFDAQKEQVVTGVVTEFQWTNPHSWVEIDVPDASGKVTHMSIEGGSPLGLARQGWKRGTLKPGDKISLVMHPMKNGDPGGSMMGVVTADGRVLGEPLTPSAKK